MILENYAPGKLRSNSPKVTLWPSFIAWIASKETITLTFDAVDAERGYTLHLTTDEARAMRDHLNRALASSDTYVAADKARETIKQVERALG